MNAKAFSSVAQGSTGDVMPWGKHKGKPLDQVPRDYLNWAVRNADHMSPELRAQIEQNLGMFPGSTTPPPPDPKEVKRIKELEQQVREMEGQLRTAERGARVAAKDQPTDLDLFRRIVKQWFGAMSRKFHPDLGGSAEKQAVLNQCYQDLIRRLDNPCPPASSQPPASRTQPPW